MTISLDNVAVEQFADMFTNVFQAQDQKLPPTIQQRRGVIGKAWHASVVGDFILEDRGAFQSDVPPADVSHTDVVGSFKDKIRNLPTDIFEQGQVIADEMSNLARISAYALNRQQDQIIIDALNLSATTKNVAAGGTNLNVDKIREAARRLDDDEVPMQNRFFIANVSQKQSLLEQTETTSSDFNTIRTLVDGNIDSFYGFKFIWFGNRDEGGIPKTGDIRTAFAYHMDSTIAAWGVIKSKPNPGVTVDWDPRSQSWLVVPRLRMGAKTILDEGIVKIACDES